MDWDGYYKIQGHRLEKGQRQNPVPKGGRSVLTRAEWAEGEIHGSE